MSEDYEDFDDKNSWRRLLGERRAVSNVSTPVMRRRRVHACFKWLLFFCFMGALGWGVALGIGYLKQHPEMLRFGEPLPSVKTFEFVTNGVLTREWAQAAVGFDAENPVEPDVRALQKKIEAHRQVREASLERIWPDRLKITLREEEPVARVRAALSGGRLKTFLVSRRGVVYEGSGYAEATLRELPYLDGVVLHATPDGFAPVPGMAVVGELLDECRLRLPNMRAQWHVVSLEDFEGDTSAPWAVIRVRSGNLGEIIFAPRDFARQLDRLATAANDFAVKNQKVKRIDLSMGDIGVAQFEK